MKRILAYVLFLAVGVGLTLVAVYALWRATMRMPAETDVLAHFLWITGELFLGGATLLAAVFFSVQLAMRLFREK